MAKRILIVDDEPDIRRVVQISIERFGGWQTSLAASGQEGLQKLHSDAFDAILLDISMPDMTGYEFYEQLQGNPIGSQIPVILLTAKALPSDRQRFSQMGIAGVITKPFNPAMVWKEVAQILTWPIHDQN